MASNRETSQSKRVEDYVVAKEPFYIDTQGETEIFRAAFYEKIPVLLKGPTGCGKTRFVERMAYELNAASKEQIPLITVPCHEDVSADDLKGRHLITGGYIEGPALVAVKNGGILYLDEVVEARADTIVVMHPLGDDRRTLTVESLGEVYEASDNFMLVASYNPGYQRRTKDLKQSTRQRFIAIEFGYPPSEIERKIIEHEANVDEETADALTKIGQYVRNLKGKGLEEGASTRLLIDAGKLIRRGISPKRACNAGIINPITDNVSQYQDIQRGLEDMVENLFPDS